MKILFNKYVGKSRILFLIVNLIVLSLLIIGSAFYYDISAKNLSQYYMPEEDIQKITSTRMPIGKNPITKIRANGYELIRDKNSKNWFYSLIDEDKNATNPKLKFYTIYPDIKIAALNKNIDKFDISKNIPLTFIAYDDNKYHLFNITCTTLPILSLKDGEIYLFDNRKNAGRRVFHSYAEYHPRGRTTRIFPKKSLSLKLKTYSLGNNKRNFSTSLLGMPKRYHWHLYAGYNDPLKIRNVFSSKLWKESCAKDNLFNLDNGYEYKYIELFKDGYYSGLYALGYPLTPEQLLIDIKNDEYMFKKSLSYEPFYIVAGKYPDNTKLIKQYIDEIYNPKTTPSALYENADITNAVDFWLFINLTQASDIADGTKKISNAYFTRKKYKDGYKFMFTPWDLDFTWGTGYNKHLLLFTSLAKTPKINVVLPLSPVYSLIEMKDEKIFEIIDKRYSYLRENYWNEDFINPILDEYEDDIFNSGAYIREQNRWKNGLYLDDYKTKLSDLRNYIKERIKYMDLFVDYYKTTKEI